MLRSHTSSCEFRASRQNDTLFPLHGLSHPTTHWSYGTLILRRNDPPAQWSCGTMILRHNDRPRSEASSPNTIIFTSCHTPAVILVQICTISSHKSLPGGFAYSSMNIENYGIIIGGQRCLLIGLIDLIDLIGLTGLIDLIGAIDLIGLIDFIGFDGLIDLIGLIGLIDLIELWSFSFFDCCPCSSLSSDSHPGRKGGVTRFPAYRSRNKFNCRNAMCYRLKLPRAFGTPCGSSYGHYCGWSVVARKCTKAVENTL